MGSRAMLGVLPVMSTSALNASPSPSSSSMFSMPQPGLVAKRAHTVTSKRASSGAVTAVLPIQPSDDPRRSAFGRRPTATMRQHIQGQAAKQTFSSFDDMIEKCEVPVLVDFYAVWCGPCQLMVPILNEVGSALKDKIRVVKIDTEKYQNLASRFDVHALPTLMLFQNGQPIDKVEGALQAKELIERIQRVLSMSQAKA